MSNSLISYFSSGEYSKTSGEVEFLEYLDHVKNGRWQDKVLAVRTGKLDKNRVPSVTASGTFDSRRRKANFKVHSGYVAIDIDADDNPDLAKKRETLQADPYCFALHHSIRGFGLVFYVKISPERHLDSFLAIEKYLANQYGVVVDPSGKDVSRLRYISYDPDLYLNQKSKKWNKFLPKKEVQDRSDMQEIAFHDDDIKYVIEQITKRGVNIAEDYHSWLHISFALASEFGESGRDYFHAISRQSSKYEHKQCENQYSIALKRQESGVTIGTFFYYCKEAGLEILTPETRNTVSIYRQRLKMEPGRSRKEAAEATREYMEKMHQMDSSRIDPILARLDKIPSAQLKDAKINDKVAELENFVKQFNLRHNLVTNRIELDGQPINDRDINTIYRKAMHVIDFNINKGKVWDVIDSDIIESYNPFLEFLEKNKHLRPKGRIREVLDCFKYEAPDEMKDLGKDYLEVFLTRWLVSIIASMNGTYSLLVLVLVGGQGTGKTKFFRLLLPDELQQYYAESKLDGGKDDEMLMCQCLIIMDDEFGGKSKIEAKKFKELSSRESFTIRKPYGRTFEEMKRYAVLCGTSNDYEVLNDTTGNRRLIPVNLLDFNWKKFEQIDKTELFIELYHKWRELGDDWMLDKDTIKMLNDSTSKNEQPTPEEELLMKFFRPASNTEPNHVYMTNTDIRAKLDTVATKSMILRQKNLGLALTKLGYVKEKKMIDGNQKLYYCVVCEIDSRKNGYDESNPDNKSFTDF